MKTITVELPTKAAAEIHHYVRAGWFASDAEAVRAAVLEFVRRNRVEMLDRFMREDIAWALRQKKRRRAA
jgi:Arc/MetJ-type ribon-helix-helix transcriptional regulator